MKPREVMAKLRRDGWMERPGKGSHVVFRKGERTVIVSRHASDLRPGMLRAICRQAGWEYPPQR